LDIWYENLVVWAYILLVLCQKNCIFEHMTDKIILVTAYVVLDCCEHRTDKPVLEMD